MKVVHVNSYDCNGGAARAVYRLHVGLRGLGVDSRMFVAHKDGEDPSVIKYELSRNLGARIERVWRQKAIARDIARHTRLAPGIADPFDARANFSDDRAQYGGDPWKKISEYEIVQLHWVVRFVDYRRFFESIPKGRPIVWTLHDMVAFTGGCHWDHGCGKFAQQCGACPQLQSTAPSDLTHQIWRRKQKSLSNIGLSQLHIVTPSRWLHGEVQRSSLLSRFPSSVIPYGLDTKVFAPQDCLASREVLRIPLEAKVILFLADGLHNVRKGFRFLTEALAALGPNKRVFLLSMGYRDKPDFSDLPHMHIDHVRDDGILSRVYSAADVFVAPSVEDNLPNTVLEAISCGRPVVGFAAGGIPDLVRPGVTGLLAPVGDVVALRTAISEMLENDGKRAEMSLNCRRIALQEYSLEVQARRYLQLYEVMVGTRDAQGFEEQACLEPPSR